MNFAPLEKIADAVLYEGYILYPYRASALKNQQRWNFGTLYPRSFAERQSPPEACGFHAEVLIAGSAESRICARIRFLQLAAADSADAQDWSQGFTRSRTVEGIALREAAAGLEYSLDLTMPAPEEREHTPLTFATTSMAGRLTLRSEMLREGLWRVKADFANETRLSQSEAAAGKAPQASAFVSAHLLLGIEHGEFVSLLDSPVENAADAAACSNRGVFPVLAGEAGDRTRMLCSPIILYDYPQIAPESAGDFFDGTEMDEMLALRVLTLTDDEKAEMRSGDPRAAAILARTETLPQEHLMKLHGAVRGMRPVAATEEKDIDVRMEAWNPFEERPPLESVRVFGVDVRCGDRVRLWPTKRADIMDMAMNGKVAIVEAIEQDLEDEVQFAVVLEDDPGKDMGMLRQAGHRFFFSPEEIEPLGLELE
jgi:hypothetical protein